MGIERGERYNPYSYRRESLSRCRHVCFNPAYCSLSAEQALRFLVEGDKGAVLHTGDFRAEPWFLESIRRNPILQQYLAPSDTPRQHSSRYTVSKRLETIYLDTACMFGMEDVPPKDEAVSSLLRLMEYYPKSTRFFLNFWTWGYEDLYKGIARHFQAKVSNFFSLSFNFLTNRLNIASLRFMWTVTSPTSTHVLQQTRSCVLSSPRTATVLGSMRVNVLTGVSRSK